MSASQAPRFAIAIPARNEERRIVSCLAACAQAMAGQPGSGVIVLLVNNSDDRTAARARAWAAASGVATKVVETCFPPECAHAGMARRMALDVAQDAAGSDGFLLTTDADSRPEPDWVRACIEPLTSGRAAMVCGTISLDPREYARLPRDIVRRGETEARYRSLARELTSLLDPDPLNPWPFHGEQSGASLAMTAAAYGRVGGAPLTPCGEDRALVKRFMDHDLPVLYLDAARVVTSCRLKGRASGGMADTIAARIAGAVHLCDETVEPARTVWLRASLRARLRGALSGPAKQAVLMGEAGMSPDQIEAAPVFTGLGALWAFIEAVGPRLARRRMTWDEMAAELPRLEALRDQALAASGAEDLRA
ncbi:glycosyltransferase family 2 protein [Brevundimonas sp.]|uniref:glycosyltransferase n=1 Tax=Brevundimonas sp. TaxID=1871086 RepID=UPI0028A7580F|nr:glycosyltransferase family 2 protein [Brevundimonas sp.]